LNLVVNLRTTELLQPLVMVLSLLRVRVLFAQRLANVTVNRTRLFEVADLVALLVQSESKKAA
jgi:hypothetical protein